MSANEKKNPVLFLPTGKLAADGFGDHLRMSAGVSERGMAADDHTERDRQV